MEEEEVGQQTINIESRAIPWIEKYRPKKITDISHQDDIVNALKNSIESGRLPHLLFHGPPGSGKTSTILAFCHEIFGHLFKERVLELNASDERGIKVIRDKVKRFAQMTLSTNNKVPPYKIIILDEADNMTNDAQSALRRIIENSTKITRFCLICNYVSRIISPILSRCAKFRFRALPDDSIIKRLQHISEKEGFQYSTSVYQTIVSVSNGDMRRAIHCLQNGSLLYGNKLDINGILDIGGLVPNDRIQDIIRAIKSKVLDSVETVINDIIADGYSGSKIISQLLESIIQDNSFNDNVKAIASLSIADMDYRLTFGSDEYVQLMSVVSNILLSYTP